MKPGNLRSFRKVPKPAGPVRGLDDKGRKYPEACFPGSSMLFCGLSLRRGRFFVPVFPPRGYAGQAQGGPRGAWASHVGAKRIGREP